VEQHAPPVRSQCAGEDVEQRRLAGAVRADDADGLVGPDREIDAVEDDERPEPLPDADRGEDRFVRRQALNDTP